jgi:dolichol kinase
MGWRLHRGGRWRGWLGRRFGGDAVVGDRVWRRALHVFGLAVLFYYLLPWELVGPVTKEEVLLAALAAVLSLELARHVAGIEMPTIREHEERRVASFAWFAVALVAAVLLFPEAVAVAVVLGAALVDPLIGEMRRRESARAWYPALPLLVYGGFAVSALLLVGRWHLVPALGTSVALAVVAVGVEHPRHAWPDDDLTMTVVPGALLTLVLWLAPALPTLGP